GVAKCDRRHWQLDAEDRRDRGVRNEVPRIADVLDPERRPAAELRGEQPATGETQHCPTMNSPEVEVKDRQRQHRGKRQRCVPRRPTLIACRALTDQRTNGSYEGNTDDVEPEMRRRQRRNDRKSRHHGAAHQCGRRRRTGRDRGRGRPDLSGGGEGTHGVRLGWYAGRTRGARLKLAPPNKPGVGWRTWYSARNDGVTGSSDRRKFFARSSSAALRSFDSRARSASASGLRGCSIIK